MITDCMGNITSEQPGIPFSLECYSCDAGQGISSLEEARLRGWRHILPNDGPAWNYLGDCPDCWKADATYAAALLKEGD